MAAPQTTIAAEFVDRTCGFPVRLVDVPMKRAFGEWVPDINGNVFTELVLAALAMKPAPLTGAEVRYVRLSLEHSLSSFGRELGVAHSAVKKWEEFGDQPTRMARGSEFFIRFLILERLPSAYVASLLHEFGEASQVHALRRLLQPEEEKFELVTIPVREHPNLATPYVI